MFKYELYTGVHLSTGSTPRYVDSYYYGGANDLCYDPVGNRMYYYAWDNAARDSLYIYYYDLDTGLWTFVRGPDDHGDINRYHGVALEYFEYPGTSDSLDGRFTVGERYIIATFSSGQSTTFSHTRLRLSDHHYQSLTTTGFQKETGDCSSFPSCYNQAHGTAIQYENLDNFPTGTVAVIWSIAGSSDTYSYLNYYPITVSGGAAQNWQAIKHQNLPRDPTIDSWYYNDDFTNRSHFFWYEDENDKLVMTSSYNNDVYAIEYQVQNNLLWRRYLTGDKNFFDAGCDAGWLFGRSKYYDGYGRFWFMFTGYDDEIWMNFPVSWERSIYETSGTYTTPVFKYGSPTYWRVKTEIPANTSVATSADAVSPTIEIRSSDIAPTAEDSHYNVMFSEPASPGDHIYPMGFDYDGNELWRDDSLGVTHVYYYDGNVSGFCVAANKFYPEGDTSYDVNSIAIWNIRRSDGIDRIRVVIYNRDGGITYARYVYTQTYSATDYWRPTNALINSLGNTYVTFRGLGTFSDRLSILTDTGWWNNNVDFTGDQSTLYSMCLAGEEQEDLWIIKEDENAIYRYSSNLTELMMIDSPAFQNANGICEDGAGGFWVGDYGGGSTWIRHYDQDGTHVATYDVTDHVAVVWKLEQDYQGGVWLLDSWGDVLARFASNGTLIGKVGLLNPRGPNSTPLGAYCMSATYDDTYFVDMDVNLNKTVSHPVNIYLTTDGSNWRGAQAASIDVSGYLDADYIGNDPHWGPAGDLEWEEVGKDLNFAPYKTYHQARITLRSDGSDTPEVEKVALPPAVTLYNVGAQSSKNVYLKTVVPQGTSDNLRQGKIRTWFSVEE